MFKENAVVSCEFCAKCWGNFRHLSQEELEMVNNNRYEATFKPGEILIKQGSPASNAIFLLSGMAKVYMEGYAGKNLILNIASEKSLLSGPGVHAKTRYCYTVAALTEVKACFISTDIIRKVISGNSVFAASVIDDLSEKAFNIYEKILHLTQKKMHGRLAEALLYFSDNLFHSDDFEMILSRQELGEMTNMAKESVVRILSELENEKIINATPRSIRILDREKLNIISEKG